MSGDPLQPAVHEETLIGYALNRLLRGDTSTEAYYSLRRDEQFSHYSTQAISGAIRVAQRLQTTAASYMLTDEGMPLSRLDPTRYGPEDVIGYRIVMEYTDANGVPRAMSVVMNARAGVPRDVVLEQGEAYLRFVYGHSLPGGSGGDITVGPRVTSILPGGYQGGQPFTDL